MVLARTTNQPGIVDRDGFKGVVKILKSTRLFYLEMGCRFVTIKAAYGKTVKGLINEITAEGFHNFDLSKDRTGYRR